MRGPLVVVGDVLLDIDIEGTSDRLSPDAPVPVVDCLRERPRPGGAGLAALLAAADTRDVVLVTACGDDDAGRRLRELLRRHAEVVPINLRGSTPCKLRVRAHGQSVVRLDVGAGQAGDASLGPAVTDAVRSAGAVLVADYGRGVARHPALRQLLASLPADVPVVWDPHLRGTRPLPGSRLVTPNSIEAMTFAGEPPATTGLAAVSRSAQRLARQWAVAGVAVTLGWRGALLACRTGAPFAVPSDSAADLPAGADVCGAGDRFAARATWVLGSGGTLADAVCEGVTVATRFVTAGGAAAGVDAPARTDNPATPRIAAPRGDGAAGTDAGCRSARDLWRVVEEARSEGGTIIATGGCFDLLHAGHVDLLRQARRLGDCLVVCVNSDASVRRLKGPERPIVPLHDRIRVLEALADVDAVAVFDEDTPAALLERLRPDIWAKGSGYAGIPIPEADIVRAHGGEVALLPHTEGLSTTKLIAVARTRGRPAEALRGTDD